VNFKHFKLLPLVGEYVHIDNRCKGCKTKKANLLPLRLPGLKARTLSVNSPARVRLHAHLRVSTPAAVFSGAFAPSRLIPDFFPFSHVLYIGACLVQEGSPRPAPRQSRRDGSPEAMSPRLSDSIAAFTVGCPPL